MTTFIQDRCTLEWYSTSVADAKSLGYSRCRKTYALRDTHPAPSQAVRSWNWLCGALSGMPIREEFIGGQRQRYLNRSEVLA